MTSLFSPTSPNKDKPLAESLRPTRLDDVIGQEHLLGPEGPLYHFIKSQTFSSFILWGPPGAGKTTLARLVAKALAYDLRPISAAASGISEVKKVFEEIQIDRSKGRRSLIFVDEIHRFNRAQQDFFLPYVEEGRVPLVGATTENPSFEINKALLSRVQVYRVNPLSSEGLKALLERAEDFYNRPLPLEPEARKALIQMADGDGRALLNFAEILFHLPKGSDLRPQQLGQVLSKRAPLYDKKGDEHYNLMSALHKAIRGSDVDAALYWLARMLEGGEDPLYIARRLIRCAVEDIGLADPQALPQALYAHQAYTMLGSPEGELSLAQCVIYLSTSPKSNKVYKAFKEASKVSRTFGSLSPPAHILNAPTKLMKDMGYGKGYIYDHNTSESFSGQNYFPDAMNRQLFYTPKDIGFEKRIKERLDYWNALRDKKS